MVEDSNIVKFNVGDIECVAFVMEGLRGLNMRSCVMSFDETPKVNIEYLPERARVMINDGQVWFDTDEESGAKIEALFETGTLL